MSSPARKVVCSFACGPQVELLELARGPLEDFAARHGYDLVLEDGPRAPERPASWSKIPLLRDLLDRYEIAVWIDADAIFVDTTRDIASEVEDERFLYLVQHRYGGQDAANCGVLMLRSSDEARAFLDDVWGREEFVDHPWWEQAAILTMLGYRIDRRPNPYARISTPTELFARTKLLSTEWNSIVLDPSPRPLLKHYPSLPHGERVRLMQADLAEFLRRREAESKPAAFDVSIVLSLGLLAGDAWPTLQQIAALPEGLSYEVLLADDGDRGSAVLLDRLDGDVTVVTGRTLAESLDAAADAARGRVLVAVGGPSPVDSAWLARLVDAASALDAGSAICATAAGTVAVPTSWAIRRSDLLALGGCTTLAPDARSIADVFTALSAQGRRPAVAGIDAADVRASAAA